MALATTTSPAGTTPWPALAGFHPVVAGWFAQRFPAGPTAPQIAAWPLVRAGRHVLVASPTGSGKTLAAFLVAIDRAYWQAGTNTQAAGTSVVYVSPLKALAADMHQNLELPLAEMADHARQLGFPAPELTVGARTGDTSASTRAAMVRRPPTVLVTTPESLYLMLTAERARQTLTGVRTVIVDEIHAVARDKRGSHLALSLQRLQHLQGDRPLQRVGLSATQRPIEQVARFLAGTPASGASPAIVDCGDRRPLQLRIEVPGTPLQAVASTEQLHEVVERIAGHVGQHRTTLVFVNTRRMSERIARLLGEQLGSERVAAHHGSLSTDRRLDVEHRLRSGDLCALVATASLELGIDVGPVDLVCQLGSPRTIGTLVQRVGRANHRSGGVPEGIVFPFTRDELVECVALVEAARQGNLDTIEIPVAPLDILVQQIVAEVAGAGQWNAEELFSLFRGASPYADLTRESFDEMVSLATDGIPTGRGRRLAFVHHDGVNDVLRPRRGARLAALTSGGAIPDVGEYRVILDPDDTMVGTVTEDFAIESLVGDVFVLGTHSWRVRRVEPGILRVTDADGAAPTIPFWTGEAPSRSRQLSDEVSNLRLAVADLPEREVAIRAVRSQYDTDIGVAEQVVDYLHTARAQLGVLPNACDVVFERFFDESGAMQLVVHAPYGGRVTRALGLALRKRFCATFDFELQAAAGDDSLLLSLGAHHAFPLSDAPRLLRAATAPDVLRQAVLTAPFFPARWRYTLARSLAILRLRGGRRTPLPIQRMESDDLMAAVFPALAACQENTAAGPVRIPDHPLVRQTMDDCLHEALDVDAMVAVLRDMESGRIRVHLVDGTEPSVLAHEILSGKPFTFLDDAPLEERRSRAVSLPRGLPDQPGALTRLHPDALDQVAAQVAALPRTPDELHDLLVHCVVLRPLAGCEQLHDTLVDQGRAGTCTIDGQPDRWWSAAERRHWIDAAIPGATVCPDLPSQVPDDTVDPDVVVAEIVEGHLMRCGPTTAAALAAVTGLPPSRIAIGLARLQATGVALQGRFDDRLDGDEQWCARPVLIRAHARARRHIRAGADPVTAQDYVRFLVHWQHLDPPSRYQGRAGLLAVVDQLQGFEAAAAAWEDDLFPGRVEQYSRTWLDDLCRSGRVTWGRVGLRPPDPPDEPRRGAATPSRSTPITFTHRSDLPWILAAARNGVQPDQPAHGAARDIVDVLHHRGASFHSDLATLTRRLPTDVEVGLWDLVARGLVTADSFQSVRTLLGRHGRTRSGRPRRPVRPARFDELRGGGDGRWSLLPEPAELAVDELADTIARQLVRRWGVVFWDVTARETLSIPWRSVLRGLRRLEDRGQVLGGRFVTGFAGEQFADPEAVALLRHLSRQAPPAGAIRISAADPLNVAGILLPGPRIPALRTTVITLCDGLVEAMT